MRSRRGHHDPEDLTIEAFLAGPDRAQRWAEGSEATLFRINEIHERTVAEILEEHPAARDAETNRRQSQVAPGFHYSDHADGVILRCTRGWIAGVYLGLHLALHASHRSRGLGSELVLERFARDDSLPGWELDPPAYTRAGFRAHRRAWHHIVEGMWSLDRGGREPTVHGRIPRPCTGAGAHA